ncbi:MAG: hypothetical protein GX200_00590 [Firmicutes bacterium]|nr:hypothetical protein [Bacillota bacterium]
MAPEKPMKKAPSNIPHKSICNFLSRPAPAGNYCRVFFVGLNYTLFKLFLPEPVHRSAQLPLNNNGYTYAFFCYVATGKNGFLPFGRVYALAAQGRDDKGTGLFEYCFWLNSIIIAGSGKKQKADAKKENV